MAKEDNLPPDYRWDPENKKNGAHRFYDNANQRHDCHNYTRQEARSWAWHYYHQMEASKYRLWRK